MIDSIKRGAITELYCQLHFLSLGYEVSAPISPCRYDFLVDLGSKIIRVQCKTARPTTDEQEIGSIIFECRSSRNARQGNHEHKNYTKDEIDYFYTCWDGKGYLVPIEECSSSKTLRLKPAKNGVVKGMSFATDYEIEKILNKEV